MKNKNISKINYYPSALTFGCSDCSGVSGIQADLRTFNAYAVYGCCAVTAVAARDENIMPVPTCNVAAQTDAVLAGVPVRFAKSGLLVNADIIRAVAQCCRKYGLNLVADTEMFSNSGMELLEKSAYPVLMDELLPLAAVITPDIAEAEAMLGCRIRNEKELFEAAKKLSARYNNICVVKGAEAGSGKFAVDAVAFEDRLYQLRAPLLKNCRHTCGAGSTFSAAICANMALGMEWDDALIEAKTFVFGSLAEPVRLGDSAEVMYPPETDFSEHISLLEI